MSNTDDKGSGGASITPSARRSIHSHSFCPFAYSEAMGRYKIVQNNIQEGMASHSDYRVNRSNEQGTDEVDNHAWSKPAHPITPTSFTNLNKSKNRRNSLDVNLEKSQDDINLLSKSLPATLPSNSYCSNVTDDESSVRNENSDISYQSAGRGTPRTNNNTPVVNRMSPVTNTNTLNRSISVLRNERPLEIAQDQAQSLKMLLSLVVLIAGVLLYAVMYDKIDKRNVSNKVVYDELRFYNDIDILGNKYRIDDNAVLRMQTGIATIFERQDTGSFVFVYDSSEGNFNTNEFNTFINDVSVTASKYLRNESTPAHYTMVEGSTLDMDEHGELISRFREDLHRTGVMLVKHLEAIPSALAMAFHYYCDEYNPLVKKSAIFFTLNLAKCSVSTDKTTHAVIEKCLAQKWNGVSADSIGPLLTRVVNVVIDLTTAF